MEYWCWSIYSSFFPSSASADRVNSRVEIVATDEVVTDQVPTQYESDKPEAATPEAATEGSAKHE